MSAIEEFRALCAAKVQTATVIVNHDGIGKTLRVRALKAKDRAALLKALKAASEDDEYFDLEIAKLVLCDENGEKLIQTPEDAAALEELPIAWLKDIAKTGLAVNGAATDEDEDDPEGN